METAGAAAATAIARVVELLWVFWELRKKGRVKIRILYIRKPDQRLKKDFWHYTLPVLGNELVWGGGFTMYSVIMGHLGTDAVAANSIANIVKNLIASLAAGIGNGGSIMVGNELGAGRLEMAKAYGKKLCHIAVISGILSGIFLLLISPLVLQVTDLSWKICKWNYHRRNFLCRRRFQIRIPLRCSDPLVLYSPGRPSGCLCAEVAGTGSVFYCKF